MRKWSLEIVRDANGRYSANMTVEGKRIGGLPENVSYPMLRSAIRNLTGIEIPKRGDLPRQSWERQGRKSYARIDATQPRQDCPWRLERVF